MEYEEVIVWNFFSSSGLKHRDWQLCYQILIEKRDDPLLLSELRFEHTEIASELKKFYVAVTRARSSLILYEQSMPFRRSHSPAVRPLVYNWFGGVLESRDQTLGIWLRSNGVEWERRDFKRCWAVLETQFWHVSEVLWECKKRESFWNCACLLVRSWGFHYRESRRLD